MFEIVRILYKELHYQIVKRNPIVANDEKKFKQQLKTALSVKRNIGFQSLAFLAFGAFSAVSLALSSNKYVMASLLVSLALIPFIFSLYVTAVQSSYVLSVGLFEPLKTLPIRVGALYLSELLFLDLIPAMAIVLPSVAVLAVKFPVSAFLVLLWMLMGVLAGHTIGLVILTFFGLRISVGKSRGHSIKSFLKIVALFLFMSLFYALYYIQEYLVENSEKVAAIIGRYSLAYPFTVASVFEPIKSFLLLAGYAAFLAPIYYFTLKKVWERVLEPQLISERAKSAKFKASAGGKVFTLLLKDLRIIFRKTAMLTGFLVPLYIVMPQLFIVIKEGKFSVTHAMALFFAVGLFTTAGADAVLKVEGKVLDFLRTLPLDKNAYAVGKALSMSVVPSAITLLVFAVAYYFNGSEALYLLPYTFLLPLTASLTTMFYFFHYEGNEIGVPEVTFAHIILLFILVGMLFAIIGIPPLLIATPLGYFVSYAIAAVLLGLLLFSMRR
ncbi:hypothetical protein PAP_02510 [Palaeococcus pacificus DY20341]|uniref:Uncharacterized protein n=1 Tax=Palaeococcus pacificus DY20341 TaxID=1343739 RepID=A0A075LQE0_9EURY|nr:hypothetical protein [Palaeococcus pacificus]AIF68930.1 hypothetical protein PAP_02510 [Palaeococcus pacificus DY20341]